MNKLKYSLTFLILLGIILAQNSSITLEGGTNTATSAHFTITTDGYFCPDKYIIETNATLDIWDPSAICSATIISGCFSGSIIYNTVTGKFNFCEDGIWVEK